MTQEHPITPPPELVAQWFLGARAMPVDQWVTDVATQAANWGADQELEACCKWVANNCPLGTTKNLCAARRPKPPSLKEQALEALQSMQIDPVTINGVNVNADVMSKYDLIRRALEALDD